MDRRLDDLTALYRDYLEGYAQRLEAAGPLRGLHKFLLGNSTPNDRKADKAFYQAVEQASAALSNADEDTIVQAVRYMTLEAEGADDSSRLMIEAAQGLAIPLVDKLPGGEAAAILAGYKARYPKKRMLSPRQRELLAALERKSNETP